MQLRTLSGRRTTYRILTAVIIALALGIATFSLLMAADIVVIDTFNTAQVATQTGIGSTTNEATDAGNILGEQREFSVTHTAVGNQNSLELKSGTDYSLEFPDALSFSANSGARGEALIVWDGQPSGDVVGEVNLHTTKLVDLTQHGNDAIVIELISGDQDVDAVLTLYGSTAAQCSTLTRTLPEHNAEDGKRLVVFPLVQFSNTGTDCTSEADLSSVYAITLKLINTGDADATFDMTFTADLDYGDLPEQSSGYNYEVTTLPNDGAAHMIGDLYLGASIDAEPDGQPDTDPKQADGDDSVSSDDEDGVTPHSYAAWSEGPYGGAITLTVTGADGCLSGWIDFGNSFGSQSDNSFDEPGDRVFTNTLLTEGTHGLAFDIPSGFDPSDRGVYARFRLFETNGEGKCPTTPHPIRGQYVNGEVEDYWWDEENTTAVTFTSLTAKTVPSGLLITVAGVANLAAVAIVLRKRN